MIDPWLEMEWDSYEAAVRKFEEELDHLDRAADVLARAEQRLDEKIATPEQRLKNKIREILRDHERQFIDCGLAGHVWSVLDDVTA